MNRSYLVGFVLFLFFLVACGNKDQKKKAPIAYKKGLIHPLFFQPEIANNLTFAFWFNDSIAKSNDLKIIRFKYLEGSEYGTEEKTHFPKKIVKYILDRNGKIIHIQETSYSEGIVISTVSYWLKCENKSVYSYAKLDTNALETYNPRYHKTILDPVKSTKKYFILKNRNKEVKVNYIYDPKLQKPLAIEKIFHPNSNDWIILGRPSQPIKRYQVYNTVKEKNVIEYEYNEGNLPSRIKKSNFPFTTIRNFTYENGQFKGFLDSTFIDQTFVTSEKSTIIYNDKKLPHKLIRKKEHQESDVQSEFNVIIEYEYWK